MIVIGAYSHARSVELVFGGVRVDVAEAGVDSGPAVTANTSEPPRYIYCAVSALALTGCRSIDSTGSDRPDHRHPLLNLFQQRMQYTYDFRLGPSSINANAGKKRIRAMSTLPLVRRARNCCKASAEYVQDVAKILTDPYRPERYYMRGPGPKWRAKHGLTASDAHRRPDPPARSRRERFVRADHRRGRSSRSAPS